MTPPVAAIYCTEISELIVRKGTEMAEYERGSMDTSEQQKTFAGFVKMAALVSFLTALTLIFLAIVGT